MIGVVGLLVIVGLYAPYIRQEEQRSPSEAIDESAARVRVIYSNRGFEPTESVIDAGTTVEWVNESGKPMWVASDDHPLHTKLPDFDQKGTEGNVDPRESFVPVAYAQEGVEIYRYTFRHSGRWGYHNHLVPSDRGVVIVE